ncbi:nucleoside-diphosphate kinase [Sphaerochaeta halotolerans]|uniref:nucleoside-diphosphate kinase n=1 Tax=Sphaerochaeta halotolerans TaxID=2293840 RepID=UPI00136D805C|nr:nucleoside-diphosphate kinase [Sphaerochaeta halotolerans]MXI85520.1 nucleoside-diphosphate kinase [Sphaerochaeta halotolerans]
MEQSLSYVLVTPYTVAKSRTGGVLSRLLSRISLELVGAQMIAMDQTITEEYALIIRTREKDEGVNTSNLLSSYIEQNLGPTGGVKHRSLLLLFKGEHPCDELTKVVGSFQKEARLVENVTGMSIRDTYADLIYTDEKESEVLYFEPAVITAQSQNEADQTLALFGSWLPGQNNIVKNRPPEYYEKTQRTLVIIKPDNWKYASSRPGMIIDMFSRSGLRIVGIKVLKMSVSQALQFYGPTKEGLKAKLAPIYGMQARELLESEFNVLLGDQLQNILTNSFGDMYSEEQFERIVEFMAGIKPSDCKAEDLEKPGLVKCMVLIYEGVDAIGKIRTILGATDPNKALAGTIRREFGSNIRVNAAHASDSPENAQREMGILQVEENFNATLIKGYLESKATTSSC